MVHVGESGVADHGVVEVTFEGVTVRLFPLSLACCAVEAAEAVDWLVAASQPPGVALSPPSDAPVVNVLLVAGTVTWPLLPEVTAAWEAMPEPRSAIAFGACTISGGPYWDSYAVVPGLLEVLPGAVAIPGCPPRPDTLVDGLRVALDGATT